MTDLIDGLRDIASRYHLFIVDQWGVLHDGRKPAPGAIETLRALKAAGKIVVLLSNVTRRADVSVARLELLGYTPDLYDVCLTSGQDLRNTLARRTDPFYAALGKRVLVFASDNDRRIFEGLGYDEVHDIDAADFVVTLGLDRPSLDDYRDELDRGLERALPLVCANPDRVVLDDAGRLVTMPGALAEYYERHGGEVRWHGKPMPASYEAVLQSAAEHGYDGEPAIGIGDSLLHDIRGANDAGHDSMLIAGGIHGDALGALDGEHIDLARLRELGEEHDATPTYVMTYLRW